MTALPPKKIAILGSTGSVGRQALEVANANRELFSIEVLSAGNNARLLISQALKFVPSNVVIGNHRHYTRVREALSHLPVKVHAGEQALSEVVEFSSLDTVLTALAGFSGLEPTIHAIKHGKNIALANKEALVVAGHIIGGLARQGGVNILPVDSEHSAIFQCLLGESRNPVEKVYLTASGGPFRGMKREELARVSRQEALNHPNYDMGPKITIDSASMMNKGLEVIEARWFFDLSASQIGVIIHPQSIIHSVVQFEDGSMKAQMGLPDMKLPIQYALGYPRRIPSAFKRFSFADFPTLTFEQPDTEAFPCLGLAYEALERGGNIPCAMNAANEIAVWAFLNKRAGFLHIPEVIGECMANIPFIEAPTLDQIKETDKQARRHARRLVRTFSPSAR